MYSKGQTDYKRCQDGIESFWKGHSNAFSTFVAVESLRWPRRCDFGPGLGRVGSRETTNQSSRLLRHSKLTHVRLEPASEDASTALPLNGSTSSASISCFSLDDSSLLYYLFVSTRKPCASITQGAVSPFARELRAEPPSCALDWLWHRAVSSHRFGLRRTPHHTSLVESFELGSPL